MKGGSNFRYACYCACSGRPRYKLPGDYSTWLREKLAEFNAVDPDAFYSTPQWVLNKYGLPTRRGPAPPRRLMPGCTTDQSVTRREEEDDDVQSVH